MMAVLLFVLAARGLWDMDCAYFSFIGVLFRYHR